MKTMTRTFGFLSSLALIAVSVSACGSLREMASQRGDSVASQHETSEIDSQNLLDGTLSAASGMADPQFKPYRLSSLDNIEDEPHDKNDKGHHGKRRHGKGHGRDHHDRGARASLPAEISDLMKSADAKKDAILGIDRSKVEPILTAMKTDLLTLREISATRDEFLAKAKEIQTKYAEQLKAILPAFESLSQEQKDRVKALHDLQKKVIKSCVAKLADPASAACTGAKDELKASINAP
jgi:hypothetical protein